MVDVDRMVERLRELVEDANITPGIGSCAEDNLAEEVAIHNSRAREGEEESSRTELFDAVQVQILFRALLFFYKIPHYHFAIHSYSYFVKSRI